MLLLQGCFNGAQHWLLACLQQELHMPHMHWQLLLSQCMRMHIYAMAYAVRGASGRASTALCIPKELPR